MRAQPVSVRRTRASRSQASLAKCLACECSLELSQALGLCVDKAKGKGPLQGNLGDPSQPTPRGRRGSACMRQETSGESLTVLPWRTLGFTDSVSWQTEPPHPLAAFLTLSGTQPTSFPSLLAPLSPILTCTPAPSLFHSVHHKCLPISLEKLPCA